MVDFKGFDADYRRYFSQLVGKGHCPFSIEQASTLLQLPHDRTKHVLMGLTNSGWLSRIKQGLYVPVPLSLQEGQTLAADPWVIANSLFSPCYIGGWDAMSYWDLTDQIFNSTFVYTSHPQKKSKQAYLGQVFITHKIPEEQFFGVKIVWKDGVKLKVSDPSRTLIDFLDAPHLLGSSALLYEVFLSYLNSTHKDVGLLVDYALKMKNRAIIKRLGFLLEYEKLLTPSTNDKLSSALSAGKVKLIPTQECPRLVTKWQLWVPEHWKETKQ